jgi:predicted RNA-binding protein with PUA-like domain
MDYWIFQSNPERFNLRTSRKVTEHLEDEWPATRYRANMKAGDKIYFWNSGDAANRGIHAVGKIVGEPYERDGKHYVKVRYERQLPKHVPISLIENDKRLDNLWILKMAFGTNFLVNEKEGKALENLVERVDP